MNFEFFFNRKICGPGPRCCGLAARPGPRWIELWHRLSRGGTSRVQGAPGDMGLQSSSPSDGEEDRRRLELRASDEESERELGNEGKRCGVLRGWISPFIGVGGAPRRRLSRGNSWH
jgi:hypothetical protein